MFSYHEIDSQNQIAELTDNDFIIRETQDILDLFGSVDTSLCRGFIIHEKNLAPEFFDLKTRIAGEILQKFSNYRLYAAIIGDFSGYKSKSLNDFFRESNKTGNVLFTGSVETAMNHFREKFKIKPGAKRT